MKTIGQPGKLKTLEFVKDTWTMAMKPLNTPKINE